MKTLRIFALIFLLPCASLVSGSAAPSTKKAVQPVALGPIALATKLPEELVAMVVAYRGLIVNPEARTLYGDDGYNLQRYVYIESYLTVRPDKTVETKRVFFGSPVHNRDGLMIVRTHLFDENAKGLSRATCLQIEDHGRSEIDKEREKQRKANAALREEFGEEYIPRDASAVRLGNDKLFVLSGREMIWIRSLCQRDVAPAPSSVCSIM